MKGDANNPATLENQKIPLSHVNLGFFLWKDLDRNHPFRQA